MKIKVIFIIILTIFFPKEIKADEAEIALQTAFIARHKLNHRRAMIYAYDDTVKKQLNRDLNSVNKIDSTKEGETKIPLFNNIDQTKILESADNISYNARAFVGKHESEADTVVIVFRGTVPSLQCNIKHDTMITRVPFQFVGEDPPRKPCTGCMVMEGFLAYYNSVKDQIREELRIKMNAANSNIKYIVITGHSLGGGAANIAAADFIGRYPGIKIEVMTFGSPRAGNQVFADYLNEHLAYHLRIVNADNITGDNSDLVTTIPWGKKWVHAGTQSTIIIQDSKKKHRQGKLKEAIRKVIDINRIRLHYKIPMNMDFSNTLTGKFIFIQRTKNEDQSPRLLIITKLSKEDRKAFKTIVKTFSNSITCKASYTAAEGRDMKLNGIPIFNFLTERHSYFTNFAYNFFKGIYFGDKLLDNSPLVAQEERKIGHTDDLGNYIPTPDTSSRQGMVSKMIANHSKYQDFEKYDKLLEWYFQSINKHIR